MSEESESINQNKSISVHRATKLESPSGSAKNKRIKNDHLLIKSEEYSEDGRSCVETPIQVSKIKLSEKLRDMEEHMKAISILKLSENHIKKQNSSSYVKNEEIKDYENIEFSTIKISDNSNPVDNYFEEKQEVEIKSADSKSHKSLMSISSKKQADISDNHEVEAQQAGPQKMNVDIKEELDSKINKVQLKNAVTGKDTVFECQDNLSRSINFKIARPEQTSIESSKALDTRKTFFEADSSTSSDNSPKFVVKETISSKYKQK